MDIKTDVPGIFRSDRGYLINKDNEGLAAYKKQKAAAKKIETVQEEIDEIKNDISDIKEMIKQLLSAR